MTRYVSAQVVFVLFSAVGLLPSAALSDSPSRDLVASDWVDLGHWQQAQPFESSESPKQYEVFYSPSHTTTKPGVGGEPIHDVLVKFVWGYYRGESLQTYDAQAHAPSHYWQFSIRCDQEGYTVKQWFVYSRTDIRVGHKQGPFQSAKRSVVNALGNLVC